MTIETPPAVKLAYDKAREAAYQTRIASQLYENEQYTKYFNIVQKRCGHDDVHAFIEIFEEKTLTLEITPGFAGPMAYKYKYAAELCLDESLVPENEKAFFQDIAYNLVLNAAELFWRGQLSKAEKKQMMAKPQAHP